MDAKVGKVGKYANKTGKNIDKGYHIKKASRQSKGGAVIVHC